MAFWRTYYHLVWATYNRLPMIQPESENALLSYLAARAVALECHVYAINCWIDHVHIVMAIPPKIAVAEVVRQMKGASAHYANHELRYDSRFEWQRSYGVLTISEVNLEKAIAYVRDQKRHHAQQTAVRILETASEDDLEPRKASPIDGRLKEHVESYEVDHIP